MKRATLKKLCREEFRFLRDQYGFREEEPSDGAGMRVWFTTGTVSLRIEEISYGSAIRGSIGDAVAFQNYDLEDLLSLNDIQLPPLKDKLKLIKALAGALRKSEPDFLKGDTCCFPAIREIIDQRQRQSNQGT